MAMIGFIHSTLRVINQYYNVNPNDLRCTARWVFGCVVQPLSSSLPSAGVVELVGESSALDVPPALIDEDWFSVSCVSVT